MRTRSLIVLAAIATVVMMVAMNQSWQSETVKTAALSRDIQVTGLEVLPGANALFLVLILLALVALITRGRFRFVLAAGIVVGYLAIAVQCLQANNQSTAFFALTLKAESLSGLSAADPHLQLSSHLSFALIAAAAALLGTACVLAQAATAIWVSQKVAKVSNPQVSSLKSKSKLVSQRDPWAETSDRK